MVGGRRHEAADVAERKSLSPVLGPLSCAQAFPTGKRATVYIIMGHPLETYKKRSTKNET